jgi:3-dehydroquinate synthase
MTQETQLIITYPGGSYPVVVGHYVLGRLRNLLNLSGPVVVVTDSQVGPLYGSYLTNVSMITIPTGEQYKTLETIQTIYNGLLATGLDRGGTVVALGGGVVGDMAGFAAATYMRGVNFVQCPTTLLAMVDASIGGKTGVDLPQGKNLVGAFKQPTAVLADLSTLQTLPPAEFAAGMAEVVKHGLIAGGELWQKLTEQTGQFTPQSPMADLHSLVVQAIEVKRNIVQADPFEQGQRAWLNLGHTFAHAIEQVSEYVVRHGEAVAMGLVAAAHLSAYLEECSPALQTQIETILTRFHLPIRIPANLPTQDLLTAMRYDKKKAAGQLRFVLLREAGEVFVTSEVPETAVLQTLTHLIS